MQEIFLSPAELRFSFLILYFFCLRIHRLALGMCLCQCTQKAFNQLGLPYWPNYSRIWFQYINCTISAGAI